MSIARLDATQIVLPGIASAHSHAFQRALRGRTQRSKSSGDESFWSWRELMYRVAEAVGPEEIYALSRFAFVELALAGVTTVGEFHYVHHQPDGAPYDDRLELSDAVIRAALDAGLRICLLRVLYQRGSATAPAEGAQYRFIDRDLDDAFADIESLIDRYRGDPRVRVGIAPHSVRAVSADGIRRAAAFAREHHLPIHMHVAEQPKEIDECAAEHGRRPVELLDELGVLDARFVAVHATHLTLEEVALLGAARSFACICRTTERDLGDGAPPIRELHQAGVRFCIGADAHTSSDPFIETRAIEFDERTRTLRRTVGPNPTELLRAATDHGYRALGFADAAIDEVTLDRAAPALAGAPPKRP